MMNDEELFESLKLDASDEVDLWPQVARGLPERVTIWEYLMPLAAAAAVLIASGFFHNSTTKQSPSWPTKEAVLVQVAEICPLDYSNSYR